MRRASLPGLAALPSRTRTTESRHGYPIAPNRLARWHIEGFYNPRRLLGSGRSANAGRKAPVHQSGGRSHASSPR
jgi:hypothetical protein